MLQLRRHTLQLLNLCALEPRTPATREACTLQQKTQCRQKKKKKDAGGEVLFLPFQRQDSFPPVH